MNVSFQGQKLIVDGKSVEMAWPILDAFALGERIVVLFDPDAYLLNPDYKARRRQGADAIRNLCAFSRTGEKLWAAEFPENSDYYYKISSQTPLLANSFSSFRCEINPDTGRIKSKTFLK
jgi:hypothetical protein